jgi:hypothetical protein
VPCCLAVVVRVRLGSVLRRLLGGGGSLADGPADRIQTRPLISSLRIEGRAPVSNS